MNSTGLLFSMISMILILTLGLRLGETAPTCTTYNPNGVCASVLTYPVAPAISQSDLEQILASSLVNLTTYGPIINPICLEASLQYFCSQYFPRCGEDSSNITGRFPSSSLPSVPDRFHFLSLFQSLFFSMFQNETKAEK